MVRTRPAPGAVGGSVGQHSRKRRRYTGTMPATSTSVPTRSVPTRPPLAPRHWPVWIGVGLLWLAVRLPWALQRAIGIGIGELLHVVLRDRRRVAAANLALCFPELDPTARARLCRRHFHELGFGLFEFGRAWWGSINRLRV